MSIDTVLLDLQERLNLLNIQLVANQYEELNRRISELQARASICRSNLVTKLQRLEDAKILEMMEESRVQDEPKTSSPTSGSVPLISKVSVDELEIIPKYMRGRLTIEKINNGVELLNQAIFEKYRFLRQNPAKLSIEMRQKYYDLKDTENEETIGKYFVTENDLKSGLTKSTRSTFKLDSTGRAILAIMRHLGRIREIRGNGITRFVFINS